MATPPTSAGTRAVARAPTDRREAILEAVAFFAERLLGHPWQEAIDDSLAILGAASAASRTYVSRNHTGEDDRLLCSAVAEWCDDGVRAAIDDRENQNFPYDDGFSRWAEIMESGGVVEGPTDSFPESEAAVLRTGDTLSSCGVPIFVDDRWWGYIGFSDTKTRRDWARSEVDALRAAANILGEAIAKQETDERLRATENRFRSLVEHIPAVLYIDSPDEGDRTLYISPQLERMLGIRVSEWEGDPNLWLNSLHPDDREEARDTYLRGVKFGGTFAFDYRLVAPRGTFWIHDEATVLEGEGGRRVVQGVMFDITERKLAEDALSESERRQREAAQRLRDLDEMKNTFLAAVSHELRSPLTSVLGLSLTLQQQPELPASETADLVGRLARNARKLDRLLTDLLDIDRLARDVVEPQRRDTDIRALMERVIANAELPQHRTVTIEAENIVARVDAPKVERIVENLLVNAMRHTTPGTAVWLRAFAMDDGILIAVEDNGPGVPDELREDIFQPSGRARARRHTPPEPA